MKYYVFEQGRAKHFGIIKWAYVKDLLPKGDRYIFT